MRLATGLASLVSALLLVSATAIAEPRDPPGPSAAATAEPQDPPGRVGRLSFIEGAVQQRTADDADWTRAGLNYPVTNGFAVATQEGGRAEIEAGSMAVRVGSDSELDVNTLEDRGATLTLARGEISLRLGQLAEGGRIEIVTPRGVIDIVGAGQYHFDAGTTESPTRVAVFNGRVEVPRGGEPTVLGDGQAALITGDEPSGIALADAAADPLDDWASARDRSGTRVAGRDHVSPEMTGGTDLDQYGDWRHDPRYGDVWYPSAVPEGWAPYRYGHWAWVSPWGWTWIDDEPWGFAPFHYGRWVDTYYGWGWVPGGFVDFPIFAPALVAFVGSPLFIGVGFPAVAWFPLAPFEVFLPAFRTSIAFVRNINITNVNIVNVNFSRVNGTIVANNTTAVTVNNFANRQFVTTVSTTTFTSGQSITRTTLTQPTTRIAWNAPVASAPANARAPRTAATVKGWQSAGAGTTAAKPPLPPFDNRSGARATSGGAAAAGNAAGGTRTSAAGTDPTRGHALPPLPGSLAARTAANGPGGRGGAFGSPGGKAPTTSTVAAPTGHKLPPLPRGPAPTTAATTAGGGTHTGGASQHDAGHSVAAVPSTNPAPSARPAPQAGSAALNGDRVGPSSPRTMPSTHGTITPNPSRQPNPGAMAHGGPPAHAPVMPNGPSRQPNPAAMAHSGAPAHAPVMPNGPSRQPNPGAMAHGGAPAHGAPMRGGPAAPPTGSGQHGGGWGGGQGRMHMNNG